LKRSSLLIPIFILGVVGAFFGFRIISKAGNEEGTPHSAPTLKTDSFCPFVPGAVFVYMRDDPGPVVSFAVTVLVPWRILPETLEYVWDKRTSGSYFDLSEMIRKRSAGLNFERQVILATFGGVASDQESGFDIFPISVLVEVLHCKNGDIEYREISKDEITALSKKLPREMIRDIPPFGSPGGTLVTIDGVAGLQRERQTRRILLNDTVFDQCKLAKGRRICLLFARGIGVIASYKTSEFSRQKEAYRNTEFPDLDRIYRVTYYRLPGAEPSEFVDNRWFKGRDGANRLLLRTRR
jgi:hypothetical protein